MIAETTVLRDGNLSSLKKSGIGTIGTESVFLLLLLLRPLSSDLLHPLQIPQSEEGTPSSPETVTTPQEKTIYEWVDEKGVHHFTDRWEEVPPPYRSRMKVRKVPPPSPPPPKPPSFNESPPEESPEEKREPTDEEIVQGYKKKMEEYHLLIEELQDLLYRTQYEISVGSPPERIQKLKNRRERILNHLSTLKEEIIAYVRENRPRLQNLTLLPTPDAIPFPPLPETKGNP